MNINKMTGGVDNSQRSRADQAKSTQGPGQSSGGTQQAASFTDQVKLSSSSKSIQQIEAEIKSMPEVDDALVERIRTSIENGDYQIDYQKLAGKMLDFEENLNF